MKKTPKEEPVVDVDAEAQVEDRKLTLAILSIEEKISRQLGITVEELRKKSIIIKGSKVTVK